MVCAMVVIFYFPFLGIKVSRISSKRPESFFICSSSLRSMSEVFSGFIIRSSSGSTCSLIFKPL